jgi:uncharacterized membrane protein
LRKKFLTVFIAAVIGTVTTLAIGYLTVEPVTGTFILLVGLSAAVVTVLLLTNIKIAIPVLLVPIPFFYPFNVGVLLANDPAPIRMLYEIIDVIPIVVFTCFLLNRSIIKGGRIISGEKTWLAYLDIIFFILLSLAFLSVLWTPNTYFYLSLVTITFSRLLLYVSFRALIKTDQDIIIVVKTWLVMSAVVAVLTLISTLPYKSLDIQQKYDITEWMTLVTGFQGDRMRGDGISMEKIVSEYTIIGTFLCLFLLSEVNDKKKKLLFSCLAVSFTFSALIAQAKSTAMGLFFGILFLTLTIKKLRAHMVSIAMAFILTVGLLMAYERVVVLPAHKMTDDENVSVRFTEGGQTNASINSRMHMWRICYDAIRNNDAYMLGLGSGGCGYYLAEPPRRGAVNPHSVFLSFFFDFGIVGISLFLLLVTMSVIKVFHLIKKLQDGTEKNMLLTLLSCAISISFISMTELNYNYIYLWVLGAIGASVYRIVALKQTALIEHDRI